MLDQFIKNNNNTNMKTINQYISEHMFSGKKVTAEQQGKTVIKYHPETTQELTDIILNKIETSDTSKVIDLNDIDTSKITDMSRLFQKIVDKTHKLKLMVDVSKWNVSNVKQMFAMFSKMRAFECDLSEWDVENVYDMQYMFASCRKFTGKGLENWNIKSLQKCNYMFSNAGNMNNNLENWKLNKMVEHDNMFSSTKVTYKNYPSWY